jgi:hypothetical protein
MVGVVNHGVNERDLGPARSLTREQSEGRHMMIDGLSIRARAAQ